MNEDLLAIGGFFFTVIVLTLGIPLVRAYARRKSHEPVVTRLDIGVTMSAFVAYQPERARFLAEDFD